MTNDDPKGGGSVANTSVSGNDYRFHLNDVGEDDEAVEDLSFHSGGGTGKEFSPSITNNMEVAPVVEIKEDELSPEVQEFVEKTEKENLEIDKPIVYHQPVTSEVAEVHSDLPVVELPLTKSGLLVGMQAKIDTSLRWLTWWCIRIIKKFKGRVIYSSEGHQHSKD